MPVGMRADTVAERGTALWVEAFNIDNEDCSYPPPLQSWLQLSQTIESGFPLYG